MCCDWGSSGIVGSGPLSLLCEWGYQIVYKIPILQNWENVGDSSVVLCNLYPNVGALEASCDPD